MKRTLLISSLIASGTILAACGSMDNQSGRRGYGDGNRDAMRQAAVAACVNKTEGTAVKLTTPRGEPRCNLHPITTHGAVQSHAQSKVGTACARWNKPAR